MAVIWRAHPAMTRDFAAGVAVLARLADQHIVGPALDQVRQQDATLIDAQDHPYRLTMRPLLPGEVRSLPHVDTPRPVPPHVVTTPDDRIGAVDDTASASLTILPDLSPEAAPVPPAPKIPEPQFASPRVPYAGTPDFDVASNIPAPPPLSQPPHTASRAEAALARLKTSLSPELAQNFDLFIFVSKADRGPLAQRMFVFKRDGQQLKLLYDWAASTGREQLETSPRGTRGVTATPAGFYEFDPERIYRRYHSYNWDQDMPDAMFFNWEREGVQTGLAIHAASGDDVAKLGSRASAGCVHLSPENAATLFKLVKAQYRGEVPRFAVNRATDTMSNTGALAHDRNGNLKMADGYRVLIDIENYGGGDTLASLN